MTTVTSGQIHFISSGKPISETLSFIMHPWMSSRRDGKQHDMSGGVMGVLVGNCDRLAAAPGGCCRPLRVSPL